MFSGAWTVQATRAFAADEFLVELRGMVDENPFGVKRTDVKKFNFTSGVRSYT